MNELSIKSTVIPDVPAGQSNGREKADKAAALAALASSFKDLVHRVGSNVDTGLSSIAEQRGITAVSETREPSQQFDDSSAERDDQSDDRQVTRGKDQPKDHGRDDTARDDHGEDNHRAPEAVTRDERPDNRQSAEAPPKDDNRVETADKSERPSSDAGDGDNHKADSDAPKSDDGGAETAANASQHAADGKTGPATTGAQKTDISTAMAQAAAPTTGVENAQTNATATARGQIESGTANDAGKQNAAASLAAAANGRNQNQSETASRGQTAVQQQAQQLARAIGDDTRTQVNVNVADEAETLTSRPLTTLAAGSAVGQDSNARNSAGSQQNTHAAVPGQAQAAVTGPAQAQGGQAQGQNQQGSGQPGQAQAIQQLGAEAKGPSTTAGTVHGTAAGGEGASSSSGVSGSGQTQQTLQSQQSAQAQQHAAARGPQNGPSAAEQVSVRITRALQAGNDRISIRLNPAELGRVEVKVELAHDGRMTAVVTADNRETLDLLRRDSSELQKALQDGGIDLSSGDLEFNLRGENGQTADGGDGSTGAPLGQEDETVDTADTQSELVLTPGDIVLGDGRIDVKA